MTDYNITLDITLPAFQFEGVGVLVDAGYITEVITARDYFNFPEEVFEVLEAADSLTLHDNLFLYETFEAAGDATAINDTYRIFESLVALDSVIDISPNFITERFTARDTATFKQIVYLYESFVVTDTAAPTQIVTISESLVISDSIVSASGVSVVIVLETFEAEDFVYPASLVVVEETFTAGDSAVAYRINYATIDEIFVATDDILESLGTARVQILESFVALDSIVSTISTFNVEVLEPFVALDTLWAIDYSALAWVMNTESFALSQYDNFAYGSMAVHDGILYATSPLGIHAFVGDTDNGRNINAHIQTGFMDFGKNEKKRLFNLYMGYTGGALQCEADTYDSHDDPVYTYDLEERLADAPRNNRIKLGKGQKSRYWRLTLSNVEGSDFQVHDLDANVAVSKRRL